MGPRHVLSLKFEVQRDLIIKSGRGNNFLPIVEHPWGFRFPSSLVAKASWIHLQAYPDNTRSASWVLSFFVSQLFIGLEYYVTVCRHNHLKKGYICVLHLISLPLVCVHIFNKGTQMKQP